MSKEEPARKPRDTLTIIHDDEFMPINTNDMEGATITIDYDDWMDSWDRNPPKEYSHQLRTGKAPNAKSDKPKDLHVFD